MNDDDQKALVKVVAGVVRELLGPLRTELETLKANHSHIAGELSRKAERGEPGPPGPAGPAGPAGTPGRDGVQGERGLPGERGLAGPPGPAGEAGPRGAQGTPGTTGEPGPAGARGERGLPGDPGEAGPKGERGPCGEAGVNGARGPQGERGEGGIAGKDGAPGRDGKDGAPGQRGERGEAGEPGRVGERGERGERGLPGDRGDGGRDGRDGKDGAPGEHGRDAAQIDILDGFVEGRTYARGTFASRDGGIWRCGANNDWKCIADGVKDVTHDRIGERIIVTTTHYASGRKTESRHKTKDLIYRETWKEAQAYDQGDCVTWGGSMWVAMRDSKVAERPGESDAWRLAVKQGKPGRTDPPK